MASLPRDARINGSAWITIKQGEGMATGSVATLYDGGPADRCVEDRQVSLIEKLNTEEERLNTRLAEIAQLRALLEKNPDVHEILKLIGRRY